MTAEEQAEREARARLGLIPVPRPPQAPAGETHRGHLRMAQRLVARHTHGLRYVHGVGWHVWDGMRWARDRDGAAERAAVDTLDAAYADLPGLQRDDQRELLSDIHRCSTAGGLHGMLTLAGNLHPFAVSVDRLDAEPTLFNTRSGTLDLVTGDLRPHDPADLLTKVAGCGYDRHAESATLRQFLTDVLPDPDVQAYVARLFGVALRGHVVEHVLPIFTGTGRNGKSTLVEAVAAAFGDYAIAAEPDLLIERGSTHTTGQADLLGVRLAVCSESDAGRNLAAGTVKRLTGGDTIRARHMRQDNIEFRPSHTVLLVTNHKPKVGSDDPAMWRRLRVVPFDTVVQNPDTGLPERLLLELPAVLTWIVQGHADWAARGGLDVPAGVETATEAYRAESDVVGRFLADRCTKAPRAFVTARDLFRAWTSWCRAAGEDPGCEADLAERMKDRPFIKVKSSGVYRYKGLGLLSAEPEPPEAGEG